ncbi:DUF1858 domain-containing protein [Nitrosophilus kaiyonis]|uniref:DUF1858 domain-containing protein n=1 Tax=Nitrosophilus kaiyonis TaxID=2930200 RepID=UPI00249102DE|nr:DUF1858 domain-containing protein [Nitrosophilus kaiyonis]
MEITLETKIYDLLKEYPFMEDKLIEINPKFKKLKNPVLRRTVARIASIKQAAIVGGMDPVDLLNKIRKEVGLEPIDIKIETKKSEEIPDWITKEPVEILDGNKLLEEGKNPLAHINKIIKNLKSGEIILLKTDFKPEPLIEEFRKKGDEVYCVKESDKEYLTYIKA